MKRKLFIAILIIVFSGLVLNVLYNNYTNSDNLLELIFGSSRLTSDEKAWLKEKEFLIYSSDHDTPPLRFVDENTGRYVGLTVDYMDALSLELGIEIKMKPAIWQDALDDLKTGAVDMVDLYPSDKRGEIYHFTKPIFYQNAIMVVKNNDTSIQNVKSLNGKKVAAQRGDFVNEFLAQEAPDAEVVNTDDYRDAVNLLRLGQVDAVVGDESVIYHFLKTYHMTEDFYIHDELLYQTKFVLGVHKSEPELVDILNKGINAINRKDTLTRIQQKWFGISTPILNPEGIERYIVPAVFFLIVILVLAYLFYAWNTALKKEVQVALEESEMALQTTFDGLTHLMVVLNESGQVINANLAFLDKFEITKEQVFNREFKEFLNLDLTMAYHEVELEGHIYEVTVHQIDASSQSQIVMLKDITSDRINEKQLLSANKMAAIGQLAAGVAHEIRNPLGLIRNYTYVLKTNKQEDIREKSYQMIEKSVDRASNIIDNLLNFSSISGTDVHQFNLFEFLKNMIELHEKTLSKSHIHVNLECPKDLKVVMNLESLKHILLNLISNAIDAIKEQGEIDIHCVPVNQQLRIEVVDSGCGVSEEILNQLFHPFFTTKSPGEGTGLGLYIVYSEVEKLGGTIEVQSKLNKGTMFILTFPLKEQQ